MLDIERIGKDDRLRLLDVLLIIKVAHHLHEIRGITGVLAHPAVDLGVCPLCWLVLTILEGRSNWRLGLGQTLGIAPLGCRSTCRPCGDRAHSRDGVVRDRSAESIQEGGGTECVGQSDSKDLEVVSINPSAIESDHVTYAFAKASQPVS